MSHTYTQVFKHHQPQCLEITGSIKELDKSFKHSNILICGESHGVQENADIAYTLSKTLKIRRLAIERSASLFRPFIESAIKGEPDFSNSNVLSSIQASVLSVEMLKTIATLFNEGAIDDIECVDIDTIANPSLQNLDDNEFIQAREEEIAKNINTLEGPISTMVLLGSYHTRQDTNETVNKSALQIVRQKQDATCLEYKYLNGYQYNAGRLMRLGENSSKRDSHLPKGYNIERVHEDNYTIEIPKAHSISV